MFLLERLRLRLRRRHRPLRLHRPLGRQLELGLVLPLLLESRIDAPLLVTVRSDELVVLPVAEVAVHDADLELGLVVLALLHDLNTVDVVLEIVHGEQHVHDVGTGDSGVILGRHVKVKDPVAGGVLVVFERRLRLGPRGLDQHVEAVGLTVDVLFKLVLGGTLGLLLDDR